MEFKLIDLDQLFVVVATIYAAKQVSKWRERKAAVHLALMQGDYLAALIDGSKGIESRFSKARIAPVGVINRGDLVLFKQVGKDIMAVGIVDRAQSGALSEAAWDFVRANAEDIGIDEDYIDYKSDANYYALAWMRDVHKIPFFALAKRDRRSWVVLSPPISFT